MTQPQIVYATLATLALVASVTDSRNGVIPNQVTVPVLLGAPLAHAVAGGPGGALGSLLGLIICGLVPLLFFRLGAMGGGDVKLFAALGAIAGPSMGLAIELLSLSLAFFGGLSVMAWQGKLLRTLGNAARLALNPFLPRSRRREVAAEQLTTLRLGIAILGGTLLAIADHGLLGGVFS